MEHISGFQKKVSIFLIFALLTELTGCHSYQQISVNSIPPQTTYVVHTVKKTTYRTYDISIVDSVIYGEINFGRPPKNEKARAHLYLSSDSGLIVSNETIMFPVSSVKEVKHLVPDKKKTTRLIGLLVVGSIVGVAGIVIAVNVIEDLIVDTTDNIFSACSDINWY